MNINELTAKQTAEMLDLQQMQQEELDAMTKRHDREYAQNPASTYFAQKRLQEQKTMMALHKIEIGRLYELHGKEYDEWRKLHRIIRDVHRPSFEMETRIETEHQQQNELEPETRIQKLKKLWQKMRSKGFEKDM